MDKLADLLEQIDHRGYKAYKQLQGDYRFPGFLLRIDHVQGDPFADPSRCRVFIDGADIALAKNLFHNRIRCIALEDFMGRSFAAAIKCHVRGNRGSGKSGEFLIAHYGQQVLERNALLVRKGGVEVRFRIGLPANGRSVNAREAGIMLFEELPKVVAAGLFTVMDDPAIVQRHVDSVEDQQGLRRQLKENGLVAFIADGAVLPRMSGIDDRPLDVSVPFYSPDSLAVALERRHGPPLRGLGIPKGVTLIVGGGFHGKSTFLNAIERGVYDHIPGDGREQVVADPTAFKVRAEDRRAITGVDISPFINNLPHGRDTCHFTTQNASGSTSQAANIMEALVTGTETLLIDEDTSATNFMIRDKRMQALVTDDKEPITPLVQRIRGLYRDNGVSVILVMGGSGDFFATADTVLMMDNYITRDVTAEAKALAEKIEPQKMNPFDMAGTHHRVLQSECLIPVSHQNKEKIRAFGVRVLLYGEEEIDVSNIEQLVDTSQLLAIGYLMRLCHENCADETMDLVAGLRKALVAVESKGLDSLTRYITGDLAIPRIQELAATLNRMRGLTLMDDLQ